MFSFSDTAAVPFFEVEGLVMCEMDIGIFHPKGHGEKLKCMSWL